MAGGNSMEEQARECIRFIEEAKSIAVLTGAGISTNAGVPDFRGPKGLYVTKQYDPDTVFNIGYFMENPKPFYDFTRDYINLEKNVKPTFTHYFLKDMEEAGKLKGVITQNIDALHTRAGSKNVLEVHGSYWKSYCLDCRDEFSYETMKEKIFEEDIPKCGCGGVIKPDVVFFGEDVKDLNRAFALAEQSDLFFVIGTSCAVYPAAMIPTLCRGKIIVVNGNKVPLDKGDVVLSVQSDIDEFFKKVTSCLNLKKSNSN